MTDRDVCEEVRTGSHLGIRVGRADIEGVDSVVCDSATDLVIGALLLTMIRLRRPQVCGLGIFADSCRPFRGTDACNP